MKPWQEQWSVEERKGGGWRVYVDDPPDEECATFWDEEGDRAQLAAAAPDLYRALEAMLSDYDRGDQDTEAVLAAAWAALRKARGEP